MRSGFAAPIIYIRASVFLEKQHWILSIKIIRHYVLIYTSCSKQFLGE